MEIGIYMLFQKRSVRHRTFRTSAKQAHLVSEVCSEGSAGADASPVLVGLERSHCGYIMSEPMVFFNTLI